MKCTDLILVCFQLMLLQERAARLKRMQFKHLPKMSLDMRTEPHGVLRQQIWLSLLYTVTQVGL